MLVRSKAPLRLGLAGGGTDVSPYSDQFGGVVLNVTINMYAYCTIVPTDDGRIVFEAADLGQREEFTSAQRLDCSGGLILHRGVYNRIVKDYANRPLSFKMTTYSDAPAGSGLGSSSTMVVAILKAYVEWLNLPIGEYDIALLAYEIERVDLGLSGGKQDQYAATFGGFNFIEFLENGRVIVNPLRVKNWIKNEIESSLVLYYTGTSRESAKVIEQQIQATKSKDSQGMEGMHELKQSAYVMKEAVLKGDFYAFAQSLRDGWSAKKKTASVISNPHINRMYDYIMANGGVAAKISGAGGGGFMMILCDPVCRHHLVQKLKETEGQVYIADLTDCGTQAWTLYQ